LKIEIEKSNMDILEMEGFAGELLRSIRQGIYFGVETRIPYAITSVLRPYLFNKPSRPLLGSLQFFTEQSLQHGWVIARISFIFKLLERALMKSSGVDKPAQWHTFIAGGVAGYLIMVRDGSHSELKKQINMAIGIRTIYAIGAYIVRNGYMPTVENSPEGYSRGQAIWYTALWAVVMWHWRHFSLEVPGEMNPGQVSQMNFIYNEGNKNMVYTSDRSAWFKDNYLLWFGILLVIKNMPQQAAK
jgi:hypothetical protein